jgi:hypothetical protein
MCYGWGAYTPQEGDKMTLQDNAMMAAREAISARGLVSEDELMHWTVNAQLDSRRTFFAILFKNGTNSRRIECEVPALVEKADGGGVKLSVEITKIVNGQSIKNWQDQWTDVLFDADKPRISHRRITFRLCAA